MTIVAALHEHATQPHRWQNDAHRKRWLAMVLRNKWRDAVRRPGRDRQPLPPDVPGSRTGASSEAEAAERWVRFQRALAQLSDRERDVLRWRLFDGLKLREVAERLGMTIPGARHVVETALERLEARLNAPPASAIQR
jgi:RNA polymerase sigma factor (sigma-70 family)